MTAQTIKKLYESIIKESSGARWIKFDLHIHSPASNDYELNQKISEEENYINILDEAIASNLEIISITDHNTFSGFNKIHELKHSPELSKRYSQLLVLCGIEITTFSKHVLAIFPEDFSKSQQDKFLDEIGLTENIRGEKNALADNFGPALLIQKVGHYGGFCILAHVDAESGFLLHWCKQKSYDLNFEGQSLARILTSEKLLGLQITNTSNEKLIYEKLNNKDYKREFGALANLRFSDSHGYSLDGNYKSESGNMIGSKFSYAKVTEKSFKSLKIALVDSDVRIKNERPTYEYQHIIGCAINSAVFTKSCENFAIFRFNPELNCIIGARGTGKSTLLETIQSVLLQGPSTSNIKDRYHEAVVYIEINGGIYAIYYKTDPRIDSYTKEKQYFDSFKIYRYENDIYKIIDDQSTAPLTKIFLSQGFRQQQIYEYSKNPNCILDLIDSFVIWKHHDEFEKAKSQCDKSIENLRTLLKKFTPETSNRSYIEEFDNDLEFESNLKNVKKYHKIIINAIDQQINLREETIRELSAILSGKLKITLNPYFEASDVKYLEKDLSRKIRIKTGNSGEYEHKINRFIKRILTFPQSFSQFLVFLLEQDYDSIIEQSQSTEINQKDLANIRSCLDADILGIFYKCGICLEYNINSGSIDAKESFRNSTNISLGQHAVALLLIILNASENFGDNRPLLMDQPEDNLDNSYIFSTLVKEFRKSKNKRQIIISTHNPNIPVSADAEKIIVLEYNGESSFIAESGSIDKVSVAKKVVEILEGGEDALRYRMKKYE